MEINKGGNGENEYCERDHQRQILEKILKKSKVKLEETERELMDNLIAELDLLHMRGNDLDSKLASAPGLMELVLMAQKEEDDAAEEEAVENSIDIQKEVEEYTPTPVKKKAFVESDVAPLSEPPQKQTPENASESSMARVGPPKTKKQSVRPQSVLKKRVEEKKAEPEKTPDVSPPPAPEKEEAKARPNPENTVQKFIEAWNQKAFGAEYSCFAKGLLNMGKQEYVDCRMSVYLSETKSQPVTRKMGTLMSKKVYGNNAEILCERIQQTGPKTQVFIDDYSLSIEDGEWKIMTVRSEPERNHGKNKKW